MPKKLFSGVKLGTIKVRSVIKQKFSVINLKYHFFMTYTLRGEKISLFLFYLLSISFIVFNPAINYLTDLKNTMFNLAFSTRIS